jgi:AraC-like DNA-binding protein
MELPFYVHSIGMQKKQNKVSRWDGRLKYQIAYCLGGEGELYLKDTTKNICEGEMFFIKKNTPHEYCPIIEPFVVKWLIFDGIMANQILKVLKIPDFLHFQITNIAAIEKKFQKIHEIFLTESIDAEKQASIYLYDLLLEVSSQYLQGPIIPKMTKSLKMAKYIEANYKKDLSLEMVSKQVDLSIFHASKLFKSSYHTTILKYLEEVRIKNAKRLLMDDKEKSIREISRVVGYHSDSYFCRVFRKNEGLTPKMFRSLMIGVD